MKRACITAGFLLMFSLLAKAQYNEFSAQVGSGLFSFRGNRVVQESFFNIAREAPPSVVGSASYTNDPFSNLSSFSWGVTMQGQHVTKKNTIAGLQLAYESLATRTKITGGYDLGQFIAFQQGSTTFSYEYVNLHPFVGHRFGNRLVSLDLSAGLDVAIGLHNWEKGKATTARNELYLTYRKYSMPGVDFRPRLNATAYYHNVGLGVSYAHGLTNYSPVSVGVLPANTASQLWRITAVYRLTN